MHDPVYHRGDHLVVREDLAPPAELEVRRHYEAPPLVALVRDLVEELGAAAVYRQVPELVEDDRVGM